MDDPTRRLGKRLASLKKEYIALYAEKVALKRRLREIWRRMAAIGELSCDTEDKLSDLVGESDGKNRRVFVIEDDGTVREAG